MAIIAISPMGEDFPQARERIGPERANLVGVARDLLGGMLCLCVDMLAGLPVFSESEADRHAEADGNRNGGSSRLNDVSDPSGHAGPTVRLDAAPEGCRPGAS